MVSSAKSLLVGELSPWSSSIAAGSTGTAMLSESASRRRAWASRSRPSASVVDSADRIVPVGVTYAWTHSPPPVIYLQQVVFSALNLAFV